ncbi:sulfatase-like hydrolase/transferase [Helicobacter suis]|uniref:sulfatase-like hydrolase/transferase n=2 Tax=Helicobacter suis TaxID=104628 RepID=UPI002201189A|nr:sulfatase-like hydrolase/transferase [Helicobacter suis]BDR28797.1 hypothetical protein HSHS1_15580 [Helicobacter suis HS1]
MISAFAHTYAVFKTLLNYADVENRSIAWYEQKSLGDIFNAAGYKTFWIDNQGLHTWLTSGKRFVIGDIYDVLSHRFTKRYYALAPTDQWVVDTFIEKVQPDLSTKNFVLFHLIGNHGDYNTRFPKNFTKFTPAQIPYANLHTNSDHDRQIVADYANSLYYTDYILSEIFKLFKGKDALIVYLSDHAQDIFESGSTYGHKCSTYGVEIPFIIYVTDVFRQKHPEKLKLIAQAINKPFMSDDLIHSLLPLVGIHTKDNLESKNLFSPAFDTNRKRVYCDFAFGDKNSGEVNPSMQALKKGYAVISVNYRLSKEAPFPAPIFDLKAAVRFIKAHASAYHLNPHMIIAWGYSAGGNLAAMLGTTAGHPELEDLSLGNVRENSHISAVIDFYGPIDFKTMYTQKQEAHMHLRNPDTSPESRYLGQPLSKIKNFVDFSSPQSYVCKKSVSLFYHARTF